MGPLVSSYVLVHTVRRSHLTWVFGLFQLSHRVSFSANEVLSREVKLLSVHSISYQGSGDNEQCTGQACVRGGTERRSAATLWRNAARRVLRGK